MLVCEAAGYDLVIVETVGVGQSETAVAGMTDMFVLLQLPNAGDDLQAIKKGVMELADLVVINKADLDADAATRAQAQITSALRLFGHHGHPGRSAGQAKHARAAAKDESDGEGEAHSGAAARMEQAGPVWQPRVMRLSALTGEGVDRFWNEVTTFRRLQTESGALADRRRKQALDWMGERVDAGLKEAFRANLAVKDLLPKLRAEVAAGRVPASTAARRLLAAAGFGGHERKEEPGGIGRG
jgi:LAO/AO transport system kinase